MARIHNDRMIALEGIDGVGKTEQARRLADRLRRLYPQHAVRTVREPGTTTIGEAVRAILNERRPGMDPMTQLFLYAAARRQLVSEFIIPWLKAGDIVIADRYTGSTLAYQGQAFENHPNYQDAKEGRIDDIVNSICDLATAGGLATPAMNILYLADPWNGMDEIVRRQAPESPQRREFLMDVNDRYQEIAERDLDRWRPVTVTPDRTPEDIAAETLAVALDQLRKAGLPEPAHAVA